MRKRKNQARQSKSSKPNKNCKPSKNGKSSKNRNSKNPSLLEGVFEQNKRGFGFIKPDLGDEGVFVSEFDQGGAIHGDRVQYEIMLDHDRSGRTRGVVRNVLEDEYKHIVGVFHYKKRNSYVTPLDRKCGSVIRVLKKYHKKAQDHQLVVVAVKRPGDLLWMDGRIVEVLGYVDEPGVRVRGMVIQSGIPYEFPKNVLNEAKKIATFVALEDKLDRRLIDGQVITIDGDDTKDVDDAISLVKDENGFYRLGVHIADVNHYVRENTSLDKEARERGTSVYLADRVIPMLPVELSNGICSLNEGVDRLTVSCIMVINPDGEVISNEIAETCLNVDKHMTYSKVTSILSGENVPDYDEYLPMLKNMEELCQILQKKREIRGSISFDIPESKAELDEDGWAVGIKLVKRGIASEIIEEFMIVCNETVASEFCAKELPFVYRVHEEPDLDKLRKLNDLAGSLGYRMKAKTRKIDSKDIQQLMVKIKGKLEEGLLTKTSLRSLKRARYLDKNLGHYGLAAEFYCHFTSPIRRYPDLQIHRVIKESLCGISKTRIEKLSESMPDVCRGCSLTERRAEGLERDVLRLKKCEYMQQFVGEEFVGVISSVTGWGLFVELFNTVEGLVRLHGLSDWFEYSEQHMAVLGMMTGKVYKLGNKVQVTVARVDLELCEIDLQLIDSEHDVVIKKKNKKKNRKRYEPDVAEFSFDDL